MVDKKDTWEALMAKRAKARGERPLDFGPMPTEPPACCCEWFIDGAHGWRQRFVCGDYSRNNCDHEHHKHEIGWAAA